MFFKRTREDYIKERIANISSSLTDGEFTDAEVCEIVSSVKSRALLYLNDRNESLTNELKANNESIKKLQ